MSLVLANIKVFGGKPYPFMLAIDALTKKVVAEPLKDRLASAARESALEFGVKLFVVAFAVCFCFKTLGRAGGQSASGL